jgi:hypothetical protein
MSSTNDSVSTGITAPDNLCHGETRFERKGTCSREIAITVHELGFDFRLPLETTMCNI